MGKVGKWARQTKWRFYVLQDRFLYYYAAQTDERPKGAIFLEGSLVKKVTDGRCSDSSEAKIEDRCDAADVA